ncbi:MAG: insulinase family protein [Fimbriimonadales bacterium]|nr:insulinase family protein [Fimbriimonadales bacterium]
MNNEAKVVQSRRQDADATRSEFVASASRRRITFLSALFLFLWLASFAQPQRIQLPSGMQLIVERIPDAPLVAIEVWIRTGVADETPETSGVAHLLEHLIFKGTAELPPGALDEAFEQAGGVLDAFTERDWTRYSASVLPNQWQTPLQTMLRCLLSPALPEEALQKERRIILNDEYALHRADPVRPARYALFAEAFKNHPYGLPLLGDPETLARLDRETIRQFHQMHYRPERIVVVLAGAVDWEAARRVVEEAINNPHPQPLSHAVGEGSSPSPTARERRSEGEGIFSASHNSCLALGIRTPPATEIDSWLCAEILRITLAEPYRGLLYEGESLPFGRLQSEYLPRVQGSLLAVYALPPVEATDNWQAATRQRIEDALQRIADGSARIAIEQARAVALARHNASMRLPMERARWWGLCATLRLPLSPEEYAARLENLPVEKVEAFARAHLVGGTPTRRDADSSAGTPAHHAGTVVGGTPTRRARSAVRQRLANGLRVVAVATPDSESVIIQVAVAHTPGESPAAGELTARMLFGETQNETQRTLTMRIARSGGSLRVEWTPAGALITAFARPDSVVNVLALLKEALFRAEFDETSLQRALKQALYDRQHQEGAQGWRLTARLLNAYADEAALKQVSLRDLRSYYRAHYRPENACIVIAGDFPVERLMEFVQQFFGHEWDTSPAPRREQYAVSPTLRTGDASDPRQLTYTGYAWTLPLESPTDYHAARALQILLTEGKQSRLFQATREQRGVGYALQTEAALVKGGALGVGWLQTGKTPVPESVLQQAIGEAVQPGEWRRAHALLRGEWERLRWNRSAFTAALAWAELSGLGYEAIWNAPPDENTLTLQQVETLKNRLIRRGK